MDRKYVWGVVYVNVNKKSNSFLLYESRNDAYDRAYTDAMTYMKCLAEQQDIECVENKYKQGDMIGAIYRYNSWTNKIYLDDRINIHVVKYGIELSSEGKGKVGETDVVDALNVYPCKQCGKTINDNDEQCWWCGTANK